MSLIGITVNTIPQHFDWWNALFLILTALISAGAAIYVGNKNDKTQRELFIKQLNEQQKYWEKSPFINKKNQILIQFEQEYNDLILNIQTFYKYLSPQITLDLNGDKHIYYESNIFIEPKIIIQSLILKTNNFKKFLDSNELYLPIQEQYYIYLKYYINAFNNFFKYIYKREFEMFASTFKKQEDGSYVTIDNICLKRLFLDEIVWKIPIKDNLYDGLLVQQVFKQNLFIEENKINDKEFLSNDNIAFYGIKMSMNALEQMIKEQIQELIEKHIRI